MMDDDDDDDDDEWINRVLTVNPAIQLSGNRKN